MGLTSEEVALLLQIARDATLGEGFSERIEAVTDALALLVPCSSLSAFVVDPSASNDPSKGHLLFKNRNPSDLAVYATHYRHIDPMGEGFESGAGVPVQMSDFVRDDEFGRDEYTGIFLPRIDVRYLLAVSHGMPGGSLLAVCLQREAGMQDFSAREREILRLSSPDIARAAFGALLREKVRPPQRGQEDAAADSKSGVIVLSPLGDILHADSVALWILRQITSDTGTPEDLLVAEVRQLAQRPPVEGLTVERRFTLEGGGWGRARFSWMSTGRAKCEVVAMLEVLRPGSRAHFDTLADKSGLSQREREVAARTIRGYANRQIGLELGISPITVGSHLTNIYEKTGVTGRHELTALFLGGPALPGATARPVRGEMPA